MFLYLFLISRSICYVNVSFELAEKLQDIFYLNTIKNFNSYLRIGQTHKENFEPKSLKKKNLVIRHFRYFCLPLQDSPLQMDIFEEVTLTDAKLDHRGTNTEKFPFQLALILTKKFIN